MAHPTPQRASERELAVLHVDVDRLEWLAHGPDGPVHGFAPLNELRPAAVADAALEVVGELAAPVRSCVLALGSEIVSQRVLELPVLPPRELADVLERRARATLDEDGEEVLFHARPFGVPVGADGCGADSWTLYVQSRAFVRGLQVQLAARGVHVRRTVVARTCLAARAQELVGDASRAFVVLAGGPWETLVALVCDGETWFETVLNTAITVDDPGTHATLVQELRNLGGWWRKAGRGARLDAVVSIGMEEGLVPLLEPAMRAAFGNVKFVAPATGQPPRWQALTACRSTGPLAVELGVRPPLRRKRVVLAALLLVLAGFAAARTMRSDVDTRLARSRETLAQLEDRAARVEEIARRERVLRDARARLEDCAATLDAVQRAGVPLGALLAETEAAFDGLAELLSVSVDLDPGAQGQVRLSGVTVAEAQLAREAWARLEETLERASTYADVRVVPPTRLPEDEEARELAFRVESSLEGTP